MSTAYDTDIELAQREAGGEPGPRVPVLANTGRLLRIGQLRSLEALDRALLSGQTDAERVALTAKYAARVNAPARAPRLWDRLAIFGLGIFALVIVLAVVTP